jgi:hydroxymethylpyrimidine kinase / phosphomethylpyrimidine kinase / thiamine-phosphate diphosphorylase
MKNVLTIAGYDPSSGAGVTRDLDVFFSLGLHGLAVPTSLVVQNPQGVKDAYPVPLEQVAEMLEAVSAVSGPDGVKIGALWDEPQVAAVAAFLGRIKAGPVVLDPVMASKNGKRLLSDRGSKAMVKSLFPLTTLVTPNAEESSVITGKKVDGLEAAKESARAIQRMGPAAVIVKGGHLKGEPVDVLFDGKDFTLWQKRRLDREIHGTGCAFSSLVTSFLVMGYSLREAFLTSEERMEEMLKESYRIDEDGYFYTSSAVLNGRSCERWRVLQSMRNAQRRLTELNMVELVPAVQMNMGYAVIGARGVEDVAAFPGRIGHYDGRIHMKGEPQFGASSHVARLILTFMNRYPHVRSCVSLRYDERIVKKAQEKRMYIVLSDRRQGPEGLKPPEEKSLDYLVEEALKGANDPPDIIYDLGDIGKEPIIRVFGRSPSEVIEKMEMIRP